MTDRLMVEAPAAVLEIDDADERAADQELGEILGQHAAHVAARVNDLEAQRELRAQRAHPGQSVMTLERRDALTGRDSFAERRRRWQASAYR